MSRHCRWLAALLCLLLLVGCKRELTQRLSGQAMGSQWSISYHGPATAEQLQPVVKARLEQLEQTFSHWRADSELSRFNAVQDTGWHPVSEDLAKVVQAAQQVAAETGGALDITLAPLVELWGFGPTGSRSTPPAQQEVEAARHSCGWQLLELRHSHTGSSLRKKLPGLRLNVSALAEGYAVDELTALLQAAGLRGALVDVGGELRAFGSTVEGKPWRVGIQHPSGQGLAQVVALQDAAVATSGTYRQGFHHQGQRYSHVLDPRTARPVDHATVSVTVQHPLAMLADAYATALLVLGKQEGTAVAQRLGLQCLFLEGSSGLPHLGMQKP